MITLIGGINIKDVKSPLRLLFGAAESPARPSTSRSIIRDAEVDRLGSPDSVFEVKPASTNEHTRLCISVVLRYLHRFNLMNVIYLILDVSGKHVPSPSYF